jgi:hypothetical protein
MMAYGFSIDFLAALVSDGLVTAEPSTMRAGGAEGAGGLTDQVLS